LTLHPEQDQPTRETAKRSAPAKATETGRFFMIDLYDIIAFLFLKPCTLHAQTKQMDFLKL